MISRPDADFLRKKVMELEQALFYNESNAVLRLPTSLINALHVDEAEQVWFLIARPAQHLNEFDRTFSARLDFYRKGKSFYLQVSGKATIVDDPEDINNSLGISAEIKRQAASSMVLVKMKMSGIFYYPYPDTRKLPKADSSKAPYQPSALVKALQNIVKDIIPVF